MLSIVQHLSDTVAQLASWPLIYIIIYIWHLTDIYLSDTLVWWLMCLIILFIDRSFTGHWDWSSSNSQCTIMLMADVYLLELWNRRDGEWKHITGLKGFTLQWASGKTRLGQRSLQSCIQDVKHTCMSAPTNRETVIIKILKLSWSEEITAWSVTA